MIVPDRFFTFDLAEVLGGSISDPFAHIGGHDQRVIDAQTDEIDQLYFDGRIDDRLYETLINLAYLDAGVREAEGHEKNGEPELANKALEDSEAHFRAIADIASENPCYNRLLTIAQSRSPRFRAIQLTTRPGYLQQSANLPATGRRAA